MSHKHAHTPAPNFTSRFFTPNEEIDNQIAQLIKVIELRQNGVTAEQLKRMGIAYKWSYGAALNHIKEIAADIKPNNELAQRLWHREIRETMILATLVADKQTITPTEIYEWCALINNSELVEQMAINLLGKTPVIKQTLETLLNNNNYCRATAMYAAGWALRNKIITHNDITTILDKLSHNTDNITQIEKRGLTHLLKQLARQSDSGKTMVTQWIQATLQNESSHLESIVNEVNEELEWLSNQ